MLDWLEEPSSPCGEDSFCDSSDSNWDKTSLRLEIYSYLDLAETSFELAILFFLQKSGGFCMLVMDNLPSEFKIILNFF